MLKLLPLIILFLPKSETLEASLYINTSTSATIAQLPHFWRSTGFCPPLPHNASAGFDLGYDMVKNLALIGAIPQSGIQQVRIHWLLALVQVDKIENGTIVYNFTDLDNLIDLLYQNGLKPGFELMGNPGGLFKDFDTRTDVVMWKDLVTQVAQRYVDLYGLGYVSLWNFETWNEPDCHDFDQVHMSVQGFLNYYDACSEGLNAVSPLLKLGGPGDGCTSTKYADALLHHVVDGINYFTGKKGTRLDFISFHRKGGGSSERIIMDEIELMKLIKLAFPTLADKPFYNDEADPLVGWSKDEEWRADATYAAIVAKIITQHQKRFIANPSSVIKNYALLSNDNAFLSWYPHQFSQRTLLARLQINTTSPPHTQLFQKPVHAVMGLLALLGETQLQAKLEGVGPFEGQIDALSSVHFPEVNGTADSWQSATLVYFSNDTISNTGIVKVNIYATLDPPIWASSDLVAAFWLVDNYVTNPYSLWKNAGSPAYPAMELMRLMRGQEGAKLLYTQKFEPGMQQIASVALNEPSVLLVHICSKPLKTLWEKEKMLGAKLLYTQKFEPGMQQIASVALNEPSVLLVHICSKPTFPPDQVNNVMIYNITAGQVLITWSDKCVDSRCILTYEVVFSETGEDDTYRTITPYNRRKHVTSFVFAPNLEKESSADDFVRGFYKVRAVDYFQNYGEYSLPEQYPSNGKSKKSDACHP